MDKGTMNVVKTDIMPPILEAQSIQMVCDYAMSNPNIAIEVIASKLQICGYYKKLAKECLKDKNIIKIEKWVLYLKNGTAIQFSDSSSETYRRKTGVETFEVVFDKN